MRRRPGSACQTCRRMRARCEGNTHPCARCVKFKCATRCKFTEHTLRYDHYVLIYLDRDGTLKVDESYSTQEQMTLFTPEMRQNFLEKAAVGSFISNDSSANQMLEPSGSSKWTSIHLGDTQKIKRYYEETLWLLSQESCCMIASAFFRYIEPHKRSRHPYSAKTKPGWCPSDVTNKGLYQLEKEGKVVYAELFVRIF